MYFKQTGLAAMVLLVPATALADVSVSPLVALGYKNIAFSTFAVDSDDPPDVGMPVLSAGVNVAVAKFGLQATIEQSLADGEMNETTEPFYADLIYGGRTNVEKEKTTGDVSRQDINLTLSYSLMDSITLFGGYLRSTTNIDSFHARFFDSEGGELFFYDDTDFPQPLKIGGDFEKIDDGFMAGARYIPLSTAVGSLSVSLGYAVLDTDIEVDVSAKNENLNRKAGGKGKADTTGFSASVGWVGPIPGVERLRYFAALRLNRFTMEGTDGSDDVDDDLTYLGGGVLFTL